jgi:hypothetical protein
MRKDDPGVGNLGLNIRMDGENYSIAQKAKENNLVGFTDKVVNPFGDEPAGEST